MKKVLFPILFLLGIWFGIKYPAPTAMPKVLTQAEVNNQISKAVEGLQVRQAPTTPTIIQQPMAGASIPVVVSLFETSLATKITSTANSMTLVSGVDSTGASLSGYLCFTLDEGSATAEFVCGTTSGTSVTSMTRGISPITGTSTVSSLQFEHRRGASVKITNYPQLAIISRILNGNETLPNPLRYDSTISTSTLATNGSYVASVNYVNGIAFAGAPNATTTIQGLVQAGTAAQLAIGTQNGSTGAVLFAPGNLFASSSSATTLIPVTQSNGKLSTGFIDQTANYTWSGTNSFTGTLSLATTTVSGTDIGSHLAKFGGTGADGALSISSGTTTIDCALSLICVKNYTSISITGTGVLAFSNPNPNGTTIVLKSQGNVTITSAPSTASIYITNMGAAGGAGSNGSTGGASRGWGGGGGGGANTAGSAGGGGTGSDLTAATAGTAGSGVVAPTGGGGGNTGSGGAAGTLPVTFGTSTIPYYKMLPLIVGAGGGGGTNGQTSATGGTGGRGGGALYMEVGGALNFTGTINGSGSVGLAGGTQTGGGGGGGGASVIVLYNTLTSASGTVTTSGGAGGAGNGGGGNGGSGGSGFSVVAKNTEF